MIKNREAIEHLKNIKIYSFQDGYTDEAREALDMAIKALEAQEWIPVSERLPEDEYVLICKKPSKISGDKWRVTIAIRMADPRSKKVQWRDIGFGIIPDDKILAWQYLPEPYQEGSETDESD